MVTINISDLSVGDWVQDNYGNYVKVMGIWQGCNFNYHIDILRDGMIGTIVPCNIHPIPITVEILKKNGTCDEWSTGDWEEIPSTEVSPSRQCMRVRDLGTHIFLGDKVVYVHQLQHVLRLAGVGKEIVIPNK